MKNRDFGKEIYTTEMPEKFYEYAFVLRKSKSLNGLKTLDTFAYEYSKTRQIYNEEREEKNI